MTQPTSRSSTRSHGNKQKQLLVKIRATENAMAQLLIIANKEGCSEV